jgi:hypothetical protein
VISLIICSPHKPAIIRHSFSVRVKPNHSTRLNKSENASDALVRMGKGRDVLEQLRVNQQDQGRWRLELKGADATCGDLVSSSSYKILGRACVSIPGTFKGIDR